MKLTTSFICIAMLTICSLLFGCASLNSTAVLDMVASRAEGAVKLATLADLQAHPEHRLAFAAGKVAMDGFLMSTNSSSAELKRLLEKLPIKEFQGSDGAMVLEGAMLVYDFATMFAYQAQSAPAVVKLATAVRNGLDAALSQSVDGTRTLRGAAAPTSPPKLVPKKVILI
jgi:hypothetical protein